MASEPLSWADQWGPGGFGAMEEEDDADDGTRSQKHNANNKNSGAKGGFTKVKSIATIGVQKIKIGTSICIEWIKNQFKRKRTPILSEF
ncbi:hypothetical protein RIF29_40718 [Crotalaria pallida]|uniref:Uncharacterized protein n=1 Tax=Crotalaria pallida TaxID=3830 RepID=A0AAN9HNQ4_CROPI